MQLLGALIIGAAIVVAAWLYFDYKKTEQENARRGIEAFQRHMEQQQQPRPAWIPMPQPDVDAETRQWQLNFEMQRQRQLLEEIKRNQLKGRPGY